MTKRKVTVKKQALKHPITIRLHGYGSYPVLLFNDNQQFLEYVDSHKMVEDIFEGHHLECAANDAQGVMGVLRHEQQKGEDPTLDEDTVFYILINKQTIEVVDHEVSHLCITLFNMIGLNIDIHTQESFCYLHDYLLSIVCDKLGITEFSPPKY